jgi:hypothetical protein
MMDTIGLMIKNQEKNLLKVDGERKMGLLYFLLRLD